MTSICLFYDFFFKLIETKGRVVHSITWILIQLRWENLDLMRDLIFSKSGNGGFYILLANALIFL